MSAISANHSLVSDAFGSRCSARRVYTPLALFSRFQKNALAQRSPLSIALRFSKSSEALPVSPAANPPPPLSVRQIKKTHCAPSTPAKSTAFTAAAAGSKSRDARNNKDQLEEKEIKKTKKNKGTKKAGREEKECVGAPLAARTARH